QLQINYADWEDPSVYARANYEMVRKYGKDLVIMEPVKGGSLASLPEPVAAVFKAAEPDSSMASWALRFAASLPGVIAVLSGMSNIEQMEDNLKSMKNFPGLTDEQVATVERAREELAKIPMVPCTGCNYCSKVCPMDIGISLSFRAVNDLLVFGNMKEALRRESIVEGLHGKRRANECLKCGACEEVCPQHINIRDELERVVELLIDRK
ncbi:MAG: 4Fe-4S dicluster domain-containing protein, partial [Eubacterium sp.]|nr:4Fe-4S dicluster domain-containing protein [Eubacterium sp.]